MAETKTSQNKSKAKSAQTKGAASTKGPKAKTRSKPKASKPGSKRSPRSTASVGIKTTRDAVEDAGQRAGQVASKAKVPLIAGGAALVGAAGGAAALTAARSKGSKVLGLSVPKVKVKIKTKDLARAADKVAAAGEQVGRLSTGLRELQGKSDSNGHNGGHRSPIEVLIQGLTRRH